MEVGWNRTDFDGHESVGADAVQIDGPVDILWKPTPFVFQTGASIRYIDFAQGNDAHPGTKDKPWKHHPWDPQATEQAKACRGIHTYVFKRGVTYLGTLIAKESGSAKDPIRLTSDPGWGQGQAVLSGAQRLTDGWRKLSDAEGRAAGFPAESVGKLWCVELGADFIPHLLWEVRGEQRLRLPIAREPDWQVEDPYRRMTQWWRWRNADKAFPVVTTYDPEHLTDPDPKAYVGATVWGDQPNTSGEFNIVAPAPSEVIAYDPEKHAIQFAIKHPARHPQKNSVYYLENLPRFLDQAGEWYYSAKGPNKGRLYLRLAEDRDPNSAVVEVARYRVILDIHGQQHITVTGLSFTGGNSTPPNEYPDTGNYEKPLPITQMGAIRLRGNCRDITLSHLRIYDSAAGITNEITAATDALEGLTIADSELTDLDDGAINLRAGFAFRRLNYGELTNVRLWRNRIANVGLRNTGDAPQGIELYGPKVAEIAGNVIQYVGGQGINVYSGRMAGGLHNTDVADAPLVRVRIHHNKVSDSLLLVQDFGGIECWGTGPTYVYNNISANPVGWVAHRNIFHKNEAYYFDHHYKGWFFNNIGWSDSRDDAYKNVLGAHMFHQVWGMWNMTFQNTGYNFRTMWSSEGSQSAGCVYLGNLSISAPIGYHSFRNLDKAPELAWVNNVYHNSAGSFFEQFRGARYADIDDFRAHLKTLANVINSQVGWTTDDMPVRDPQAHDFRPTDDSAAVDRGVRVFVPWSLYGVVGEWYFTRNPAEPGLVRSFDLYPQAYHNNARAIDKQAPHHLTGAGFKAEDYVAGPLENWTAGALRFDATKRLTLPNASLREDVAYSAGKDGNVLFPGAQRKTVDMDKNNFLVETVVRIETGHTAGTIAGKRDAQAGYALAIDLQGRVELRVRGPGGELAAVTDTPINDGRWHHVLAEVDRATSSIVIYLDGKNASRMTPGTFPANVSLSNQADFVVGESLVGTLDFLRVARGTLADAQTNIQELMRWQFNGPAERDFAGRTFAGTARDAGALEHPTATGPKPIRYTPSPAAVTGNREAKPETETVAPKSDPKAEVDAKPSADMTLREFEWGSVTYPAQAKVGETAALKIQFKDGAVAQAGQLLVDTHWYEGKTRHTGGPRSRPKAVKAGQTQPLALTMPVPDKPGIAAVRYVIYLSPSGKWADKTLSGEVSIKVIR